MKVSFIATVYNEEATIITFVDSVLSQTKKPDEIVIVDGGSQDRTFDILKTYKQIKVYKKNGNRSVGRNTAIQKASYPIIVISDAGCILDKKFIENITKPFGKNSVDVVSGYYNARPQTYLQEALVPYVLVMPQNVNKKTFLPASRSMAMKKSVWKELGGFPEEFSHNEDYVFAKRLKKKGYTIAFQKSALVYWIPPQTFSEIYTMFYRFAYGDIEASIIRPKVILIYVRYTLFLLFVFWVFVFSVGHIWLLFSFIVIYILWSVWKNIGNLTHKQASVYLPILQVLSDLAILTGSSKAFTEKRLV